MGEDDVASSAARRQRQAQALLNRFFVSLATKVAPDRCWTAQCQHALNQSSSTWKPSIQVTCDGAAASVLLTPCLRYASSPHLSNYVGELESQS